jgi:hypothetical protein
LKNCVSLIILAVDFLVYFFSRSNRSACQCLIVERCVLEASRQVLLGKLAMLGAAKSKHKVGFINTQGCDWPCAAYTCKRRPVTHACICRSLKVNNLSLEGKKKRKMSKESTGLAITNGLLIGPFLPLLAYSIERASRRIAVVECTVHHQSHQQQHPFWSAILQYRTLYSLALYSC